MLGSNPPVEEMAPLGIHNPKPSPGMHKGPTFGAGSLWQLRSQPEDSGGVLCHRLSACPWLCHRIYSLESIHSIPVADGRVQGWGANKTGSLQLPASMMLSPSSVRRGGFYIFIPKCSPWGKILCLLTLQKLLAYSELKAPVSVTEPS